MKRNKPSLSHGYLQVPLWPTPAQQSGVFCGLWAMLLSCFLLSKNLLPSWFLCLGLSFTSCVCFSLMPCSLAESPLFFVSCCLFALPAIRDLSDYGFLSYSCVRFFLCHGRTCLRKEHSVLVDLGTRLALLPLPLQCREACP